MPNTRILENHHITRHGDAALPWRSRCRGNLNPPRLACVDRPQVESVGGEPHGIDLRVGPAHETHTLVGTIRPGRAAWTNLLSVLDHRLGESWHAGWIGAPWLLVPGVVAVWIAEVPTTVWIHIQ